MSASLLRALASALVLAAPLAGAADSRLNVLLIASDDMRPQLGCYGDANVKSPHLDALAKRGMLFERAYVQEALCSPSRISMLSGRYPSTTQILEIGRVLRATMPEITTLPQHFKNHGYDTRSFGKIYHVGIDDPASWSVPVWHSKKPRFGPETQAAVARLNASVASGASLPAKGPGSITAVVPAFESIDCADEDLLDGDTASKAISELRDRAQHPERPFFLAVGFANPHTPWDSPKKYWDLYDRSKLPLAGNEYLPKDAPAFAATSGLDFYEYSNVPKGGPSAFTEDFKRECVQGYLAAISYVDAQVGRVIAALDETGLAQNTIIVFWSDHGYYLGEHTWWGAKHNNYEMATRNALMIVTPQGRHAGAKTRSLVQSVDIAPTLVELCGLPPCSGLEGRSLKPILDDPNAAVNDAAFSWYPKAGRIGIAMRTDQWRFVEWTAPGKPTVHELYDQTKDPENNLNLAGRAENSARIAELSVQLRSRFPVQDIKAPPAAAKHAAVKSAPLDPDEDLVRPGSRRIAEK